MSRPHSKSLLIKNKYDFKWYPFPNLLICFQSLPLKPAPFTYCFKVSFLIALLINSPVSFISNFLGLAVLCTLVTIFSLLILLTYMLIAIILLFSPALTMFYCSAFFTLKLPFGNYDSSTKHSTPGPSQARNLSFFFRVRLLQAPWYIAPHQGLWGKLTPCLHFSHHNWLSVSKFISSDSDFIFM